MTKLHTLEVGPPEPDGTRQLHVAITGRSRSVELHCPAGFTCDFNRATVPDLVPLNRYIRVVRNDGTPESAPCYLKFFIGDLAWPRYVLVPDVKKAAT